MQTISWGIRALTGFRTSRNRPAPTGVAIMVAGLFLLRAFGAVLFLSAPTEHASALDSASTLESAGCYAKSLTQEDAPASGRHQCEDCAYCVARNYSPAFDYPFPSAVVAQSVFPTPPTSTHWIVPTAMVEGSAGWTTSWSSRSPPSFS